MGDIGEKSCSELFFPRGGIGACGRAGHLTSIPFLGRAMLGRRAKLPYGVLKIPPNKSS